jgi:hypothetical protein
VNGEPYTQAGDRGLGQAGTSGAGSGTGSDTEQCTASAQAPEAYATFLEAPETALLPWLSAAIGERGYDGRRYPSTMLLHKLGMRVSRDTGITPPAAIAATAGTVCASDSGSGSGSNGGSGDPGSCADISGNPGGNSCYGMCGNGCNCWQWVCGDCCCNAGCRTHDSHCRACSVDPRRNWWACVQCACFDWGNPLFDCAKCS